MNSLGHTARGLFVSCLVLAALVAATLTVVRRWPLTATTNTAASVATSNTSVASTTAIDRVPRREPPAPVDEIRVALTRRPVESLELAIDGPYEIITQNDVDQAGEPLPPTRVTSTADGLAIGDRMIEADVVTLRVERSPSIWINDRQYRGEVRLHVTDGRLWPVNGVPLEEYLAAVVDAEMPSAFPAAAREAQAIVARTYAVSCVRNPPHRWFDLYATPVSQNYLGVVYRSEGGRLLAGETSAGRQAAEVTRGVICTCDSRLFRTYYSACCGGRTLSGAAVFNDDTSALAAVDCEGCREAPLYRWERAVDGGDLLRLARTRSPSFPSFTSVESTVRTDAPAAIRLSGDRRSVTLTANEVKSALRLPSLMFELTGDARSVVARGRGHGHGVGLCQWGAKGLAEQGFTSEAILQHYYPGSELQRLPEILSE